MFKKRKNILVVVIACLLFFFLGNLIHNLPGNFAVTSPQSTVGYIDLQKALTSHPQAKEAMEILRKFKKEREEDIQTKIKGKELSSEERQKITTLAQKYEQEIADKDVELTTMLLKDIQKMAGKIAKSLNLTVVLDQQVVVYGGVDITDMVIEKLKKEANLKKTSSTSK